ncbi:olfactory receptor 7D4 [Cricetulus griseus]|uniref:Olfactory receptor n=1 Tax=Cricetulus griseus TaxID=10029 RepID=A0A061I632_CRIGR|nr:olfactory receptor 7D4 [Cricetulus griseus]XP_027290608.2 olfactory receptor 7D4 [Cricetulus griseus]ERE75329.1 olfactory receptor 7D4-like protein [Cricetulus griseus]
MEPENLTAPSKFILLGLSKENDIQPLIFGLFLFIYLVCIVGNLLIILAIGSDSHLWTPMYFFLCNLSFTDICFISTIVPKMLVNIQAQNKSITYEGCLTQMYFFMFFSGLDSLLLTVMAYDRFAAICHPLRYVTIMNPCLCGLLLLLSWLICVTYSLLQTLMFLRVSFCKKIEIPHYFCELALILKLACSDTHANDVLLYCVTGLLGIIPLSGILFSYSKIINSIVGISSERGKYKAFSTCGSHLSVVSLFYGTGLGVYLTSQTSYTSREGSVASVMYTVIAPMLNPFIYSLRNRDLKQALQRLFPSMGDRSQCNNRRIDA